MYIDLSLKCALPPIIIMLSRSRLPNFRTENIAVCMFEVIPTIKVNCRISIVHSVPVQIHPILGYISSNHDCTEEYCMDGIIDGIAKQRN